VLYDLGIIHKDTHQKSIEQMQAKWVDQYLLRENKWKEKLEVSKEKIELKQPEVHRACGLALKGISHKPPSRIYYIFLHEQWMRRLAARKLNEMHDKHDFADIYSSSTPKEQIYYVSCINSISSYNQTLGGIPTHMLGMFS
jgi:hypothetical protein